MYYPEIYNYITIELRNIRTYVFRELSFEMNTEKKGIYFKPILKKSFYFYKVCIF